ncbi:DUF2914 domain-containing protein [Thiomicrorhabdus cannonii]|uniref:DUF2914 domain-containing protein n=1 Tax=Thiomicrorhabdus cannonii TaxID=2748011 RepID=UPI0015BEA94E|nr:DUF2914 domain-containing protein [Thiomicrorhabdus cannonii]
MRLPETQNAKHLYAFKKGFRFAYEGKPVTQAPSDIRYDPAARTFFEQGWEQAQVEITAKIEAAKSASPWRQRLAWYVMLLVGGSATAFGLIHNIQQEKQDVSAISPAPAPQAAQASSTPITPPVAVEATQQATSATVQTSDDSAPPVLQNTPAAPAEAESTTQNTVQADENPLSLALLTTQQREDLNLTREQYLAEQSPVLTEETIVTSDIQIEQAVLSAEVVNREPGEIFTGRVPKPVRQLYFFTQIKNAEGQTLYHRWIHNDREMALIPLTIHSNLYRTWSSKRLTSAWQGQWRVEVLNQDKAVIYRQNFVYGSL